MKVFIVYFANNMISLWFQKAQEYSLRMAYEILKLVQLIQQPIPKWKVWSIHPLCQAEQSTKTPMQKSKQTGRQTNMHDSECIFAWCHPIDHHNYLLGQIATMGPNPWFHDMFSGISYSPNPTTNSEPTPSKLF